MDLLIEKQIGNAHVSLRGGRHVRGAAHDCELAAAFPAHGQPIAAEIEAFLVPLRDLETPDLDVLTKSFPKMPLPTGYRHFRLFDGSTGENWSTSFVVEEGPVLTLQNVLFSALNHPFFELTRWSTTEWLPDMIPGVLDLELSFSMRERTSPFRLHM